MKTIVKKLLKKSGYTVVKSTVLREMRLKMGKGENTMINALFRLRDRNTPVKTIIDVGAAEGVWSKKAREVFPDSQVVMIEPLAERKDVLENLCKQDPKFYFLDVACGDKEGEVHFTVTDDLDGSAIASKEHAGSRKVKLSTIDTEIKRLNLEGPFILKLDTHGYEVPILEGSAELLKNTSAVIIECYGFHVAPGSLLFWQMCELMEKKGFRLADLVDNLYRPNDNLFWQCDAVFIPKDHPSFSKNKYM